MDNTDTFQCRLETITADDVHLLEHMATLEAMCFPRPLGLAHLQREALHKDVLLIGCINPQGSQKVSIPSRPSPIEMSRRRGPEPRSQPTIHCEGRTSTQAFPKEGLLLGYVFAQRYLDELHIIQIAVAPSYRRQGIARRLLEHVFVQLEPMQCKSCLLEVRVTQTYVVSFYETLGFVRIGIRKNYYQDNREDAVVMAYHKDYR